jgi:hypothetical protein
MITSPKKLLASSSSSPFPFLSSMTKQSLRGENEEVNECEWPPS